VRNPPPALSIQPVMKRALVLLALGVPACGGLATPGGPEPPNREALIYAAVIRQLVTVDHTFGESDPGFRVVYVMDRADPKAADAGVLDEDRGTPIEPEVQEAIRDELTDLPPIEFISDRREVIGSFEKGGLVKKNGALVTLGTIPDGDDRLEIGASLYIAGLAGTWLTYVVESTPDGWEVTGTTGPIAIS
jgi:hypothetical protein